MSEPVQRRVTSTHSAVGLSRGQLLLVFWLAVGLLAAISGYAYQESRRASRAETMGTHALIALKQALELDNVALVMESNQRGFLISGQAWMLANRQTSYQRAGRLIGKLTLLVSDNPVQVQRMQQASAALDTRYRRMQERSEQAASAGLAAARANFIPRGDGSIEPLRAILATVRDEEQRLLTESMQASKTAVGRFRWLLVCSSLLALTILVAAGMVLWRELTRAERNAAALADAGDRQQVLNQELSAQAEQLIQSNLELESFSYSISHDLRAPLRHIDGYARMLAEDAADRLQPESQRFLQTIIDSARRMGLLIDDLLAFSRLGRKPLARSHVNMQDLVNSAVNEIRQGKAGSSNAVSIEIAALPSVEGDPALLRQVWANLLSNAVKYSTPRGDEARIVVTGERKDDTMHYRVRDNGVGFDMRYADKLFGVFQRLHTQDQFEGTGVGLAIVQRIISRHGGQISATSELDRGACFSFELPIAEATT